MKKTMLIVAMLCMVVFAQAGDILSFGIKGGINVAKLNKSEFDNITTGHGGVFLRAKLGPVAIQPEVLYSRLGANGELETDKNLRLDYLLIPIMLKIYPIPLLGLNIQGGPQFGYLANTKEISKDKIKNSDISVDLGIGWDTKLGIGLDARYCIGTNNIFDDKEITLDAKNRSFMLSLSYAF